MSDKKIVLERVCKARVGQHLNVMPVGGATIAGEVIEVSSDMVTIKVEEFLYTIAFDAVAYVCYRVEK